MVEETGFVVDTKPQGNLTASQINLLQKKVNEHYKSVMKRLKKTIRETELKSIVRQKKVLSKTIEKQTDHNQKVEKRLKLQEVTARIGALKSFNFDYLTTERLRLAVMESDIDTACKEVILSIINNKWKKSPPFEAPELAEVKEKVFKHSCTTAGTKRAIEDFEVAVNKGIDLPSSKKRRKNALEKLSKGEAVEEEVLRPKKKVGKKSSKKQEEAKESDSSSSDSE